MVIRDKANMEQYHLVELFELKANIGEVTMLGGHNNLEYFASENKKYLAKWRIFGVDPLLGLE